MEAVFLQQLVTHGMPWAGIIIMGYYAHRVERQLKVANDLVKLIQSKYDGVQEHRLREQKELSKERRELYAQVEVIASVLKDAISVHKREAT